MRYNYLLFLIFLSSRTMAQHDSSRAVEVSGYIETYFSSDFRKTGNHQKPGFLYSHNRTNEVNINLAFLKVSYQKDAIRSNLALGTGSYMNANLAAEPGVLKNIFEANVGIRLSKNQSIWLDAGIFPSHIGFESAISKDCWTLTRSILAENSPYYETGAKLSYTSNNQQWFISALILNGWQRIQRIDGNNTPAFGHQITYKPNSKWSFNSSSFIGNDKPDTAKRWRYFHNFYAIGQLSNWLELTAGLDIGWEQKVPKSSSFNNWYSPVLIARTSIGKKSKLAFRAERYKDVEGVIIQVNGNKGFDTRSYSINYDYSFSDRVLVRIEGRSFHSKTAIFGSPSAEKRDFYNLSSSIAISF